MIDVWLFLAKSWACLQFVIVVFPDHTHLLLLKFCNFFSFCSQIKHLLYIIKAGIHNMVLQEHSDLDLFCLSRLFGRQIENI